MTGTVVGYDPGGNGNHGFARAMVRGGDVVCVTTKTLQTAEDVVRSILDGEKPVGIGIDTLTCWSTGHSGWRPADRWLLQDYPDMQGAVIAPGGLRGAMCLNGMAVLAAVRQAFPDIFVTETHPKVLYYELFKDRYDYNGPNESIMDERLSELLGLDIEPQTEHEWDAAISILPVVRRLHGSWQDLHARPTDPGERLIHPCGKTTYMWPEEKIGPPTPVPQPPPQPAQEHPAATIRSTNQLIPGREEGPEKMLQTAEALRELEAIVEPIRKKKRDITIEFHALRHERVFFRVRIKVRRRPGLAGALETLDELVSAIVGKKNRGWYLPVGKEYTTRWVHHAGSDTWAVIDRESDIVSDASMAQSTKVDAARVNAWVVGAPIVREWAPRISLMVCYSPQRVRQ